MRTALGMLRKLYPEVVTVEDATEPIELVVIAADQSGAEQQQADRCVLARACRRQFGLDGVLVSTAIAYFVKGRTATRYRVPERVSREIAIYDRTGSVAPGNYRFIPPETGQGLGSHAKKPSRPAKHVQTAPARRLNTFGMRARLAASLCDCGATKLATAQECDNCRRLNRDAREFLRATG